MCEKEKASTETEDVNLDDPSCKEQEMQNVELADDDAQKPAESRAEVWVREVLLGIIICFAQVPESIAFAYMAHVRPPVAMHAAWVVGLICGLFGGRPGMVNGATGAFAAIINTFLSKPEDPGGNAKEIELLFPSVMMAGVFMMLVWALGLNRLLNSMPSPVMIGFCNGLATVIGLAQIHPFHEHPDACEEGPAFDTGEAPTGRRRLGPFDALNPECGWRHGGTLFWMLLIAAVAMAIMEYFPKLPMPARPVGRGNVVLYAWYVLIGFSKLPSSFLSIVSALVLEFLVVRPLGYRTDTIGDIEEFTSKDALPMPFFLNPEYDMGKLTGGSVGTIMLQGALLCCVGSIESLMTAEVVSDFTKTRHHPGMVVAAMGMGNVVSGFLGGMGGNAMIGLSTIACLNGGRERIAPVVTAVGVFLTMAVFHKVLNFIPISALTGVMIVVVVHTFKWSSISAVSRALLPASARRRLGASYEQCLQSAGGAGSMCAPPPPASGGGDEAMRRLSRFDALVIVVVSVMTVLTNIAYSVILGLLMCHGWSMLRRRGSLPGGARARPEHGLGAADSAAKQGELELEMGGGGSGSEEAAASGGGSGGGETTPGGSAIVRRLSRGMSWVREGWNGDDSERMQGA